METYLERILASTRARVEASRRRARESTLDAEIRTMPPPQDFAAACGAPGISLIAEIKRRSPSAGEIRPGLDPAEVAASYASGGARALSVLTEPEFFGGSTGDLAAAREAGGLPVLRKDFVIDAYQVVESRAVGASAVLLIVAAVSDTVLLKELAAAARDHGLEPLIEVHDEWELDAAFEAEPRVVGVNQRDLRTFEVDTALAARIRKRIPGDVLTVAESGIRSRQDAMALEEAGLDAILVGESLMSAPDPGAAAAALLGLAGPAEDDEEEER